MGAGVLGASVVGVLLAYRLSLGIAAAIGLTYLPVVLLDLPVGIAVWGGLVFFTGIVVGAVSGVEVLVAVAWIGAIAARRGDALTALRNRPVLIAALSLLLVWMMLSISWAGSQTAAAQELLPWMIVGAAMVIVATTVDSTSAVYWVLIVFVLAATASIALDLIHNGLAAAPAQTLAVNQQDPSRLESIAADDPNYLSAMVVAAVAITGALMVATRKPWQRVGLGFAIAVMVVGLAAAQSRGAFVSAAVMLIVAFVVFPRYRVRMLAGLIPMLAILGAFIAADPVASQRITSFKSTSGRSELWTIAGRMFDAHPLTGVGLGNFEAASMNYVHAPGDLQREDLVVLHAQLVHNEYLQLLSELGLPGLMLYMLVLATCMHAAWRASRLFERVGKRELGTLCTALLVAEFGMLTSTFFLSNGDDRRMWLLFALGPGLHEIARRTATSAYPTVTAVLAPVSVGESG